MATYYNWQNAPESWLNQYNHLSPYLQGFQAYVMRNFGGSDLGGYVRREITGGGSWSSHAFGAAWDWGAQSRSQGLRVVDWVIANANALGIGSIHDYQGGRIWHAGRGWKPYTFPPGDAQDSHFHFEVGLNSWGSTFSPNGTSNGPAVPDVLNWEQTAQIAYQAGFRGQALVNFVALAFRESGMRPGAHRTDRNPDDMSGDIGLWQINYVNFNRLMQAGIISNPRDLFDPVLNARAAFFLSGGGQNLDPWGASSGGAWGAWTHVTQADLDRASSAVANARSSGLLGQHWSPGGPIPTGGQGPGVGPMELPRDAQLVRTGRGLFAVFNLGQGVFISYSVPEDGSVVFDRSEIVRMSDEKYRERYHRPVMGGSAHELGAITNEWGTYRSFWENVLITHIGQNNPARNDPGVRRVLALYAARPDMSEAELRNRLEGTKWWKQRTEAELVWNDLSPAEQRMRRQDAAVQMAQVWFQLTGQQIGIREMLDSRWVNDVASGKITIGWWSELVVKREASEDPNSPWSRTLRDEEEAGRQRGVDIENTANQIRDTLSQWGLQWNQATITKWAEGIMEKTRSDADFMEAVKNQAQQLFPWKDREMDSTTAAQPWIQTYTRMMEREGSLFTPQIQRALQSGMTAWDFEQELRRAPEWMSTQNGQASMDDVVADVGRIFGGVM